jgi:hypothetical protein
MKYKIAKDNEWIEPIRKGYRVACCSCGLVHDIDFRVVNRHIQFRARRNHRATAQKRRWKSLQT